MAADVGSGGETLSLGNIGEAAVAQVAKVQMVRSRSSERHASRDDRRHVRQGDQAEGARALTRIAVDSAVASRAYSKWSIGVGDLAVKRGKVNDRAVDEVLRRHNRTSRPVHGRVTSKLGLSAVKRRASALASERSLP